MNKIIKLLITITSLLLITNVYASSFNANIIGNDTFDNEITLYLKIDNLNDFSGACKGLCGIVGKLEYDKDKIELTSINALEGFDLTQGNTIVLYKSTGVPSGTKILSMKFRNKTMTKNETTTIKFTDITASDGDKDINTNNTSKKIKFIVKETTTKKTTAKNTTSTNTTTTIKKEIKSNNNYLSSITIKDINFKFDKDILTYDILVNYDTSIIDINTKAEDNKSTIIGDGKHSLKVGSNIIKITIKAEDDSERTYTLNINREEKNIIVNNDTTYLNSNNNNYIIPIISIIVIIIIIFIIRKRKKHIS